MSYCAGILTSYRLPSSNLPTRTNIVLSCAVWLFKEDVQHYITNESKVAACFLDSCKAFDRVRHDKLFHLLMQRHISPVDLRVLYQQYKLQLIRSEWNGLHSSYFHSTNGIRQGSVIPPVLYCIYQDELIKRLQENGTDCWLGHHFFGCVSYADDLTLLCLTTSGLQAMIATCEAYGSDYGVKYNAMK